jgi:hypothetical protein
MRRISVILGSLAALLAVLLPAATAQAATIPPRISWGGVTVSSPGSTTCQIAAQTVTFTVTGLTGNPTAAWTVTAAGENGSNVVVTLPLGTVSRTDNGVTESVPIGPVSVTAGPSGQITFFVKLFDPSGKAVDTVFKSTQDC